MGESIATELYLRLVARSQKEDLLEHTSVSVYVRVVFLFLGLRQRSGRTHERSVKVESCVGHRPKTFHKGYLQVERSGLFHIQSCMFAEPHDK